MAIIKITKLAAIIGTLVAVGPLAAQVSDTASEETTSSEVENQTEPVPTGQPSEQTSPDDGSVRAGLGVIAPTFILGRELQISTSVTGGYDDNVNLSPTGSPSWYANPGAVLNYKFGNPRLAMDLTAGAGITYYFDHPGGRDYDPNLNLRLFLIYKATQRLTLDVTAFAAYQSQPDLTTALSANRQLGNFFRTTDRISAKYMWTVRLSTVTSYTFSALEYASSMGSALNRTENTFGEECRYLLFPTTTVTGQYRFGITTYQNAPRDSTMNLLTAGLDQTFSPHLEGSLHGGVQFRSPENGAGQTSPYLETLIHYSLEPRTAARSETATYVIWTNRYSLEEPDMPGGSSRETFRTNLQLVYGITPRISASLGLTYSHSDSQGSDSGSNSMGGQSPTENIFDVTPAVRYVITPHLSINAGYRHTELDRGSGVATIGDLGSVNSYSRNRYFAGLTFTF